MTDYLALADWRRAMAEMYFAVRNAPKAGQLFAWQDWRARRNNLFKHHQQSPLEEKQKVNFQALPYFDFEPDWRVLGNLKGVTNRETYRVSLGEDGQFRFTRVARIQFPVKNTIAELSLYWIEGYGGGLFLPFRDATNGITTFGGGRYLFDTIKGADLGTKDDTIVLDFNYAYNPSCAYHPRWVCPSSPPENKLPFAVTAGEMMFQDM
jgi:uncharacterized protein (DUF1684 family)